MSNIVGRTASVTKRRLKKRAWRGNTVASMRFTPLIEGTPLTNKSKCYRATRVDHTCKDEVGLIADYLLGRLEPFVLAVFEQHLAQCPDCAAFLKTYKKTVELTASFLRMRSLRRGFQSLRFSPKVVSLIAMFAFSLHLLASTQALIMQ